MYNLIKKKEKTTKVNGNYMTYTDQTKLNISRVFTR